MRSLGNSNLFSVDQEQSTQQQKIGQGPGIERCHDPVKELALNSEGVLEARSAVGREINGAICGSQRPDAGCSVENIGES